MPARWAASHLPWADGVATRPLQVASFAGRCPAEGRSRLLWAWTRVQRRRVATRVAREAATEPGVQPGRDASAAIRSKASV